MRLVEFVPPSPHPLWRLCLQMGITEVVVKVHPSLTGLEDPWRCGTLAGIVGRLAEAGLRVVGLEGDPFDMSPVKEFGAPGRTEAAREEALGRYCELLDSMGKLGIGLLCYNFMPGTGWARTGVREGRGGAKATYFSLAETPEAELVLGAEAVWANLERFLGVALPAAEKAGVRMALHPDDPCLPALGGYARVVSSVEAYERVWAMRPSRSNAVTFCQANFTLMGEDLEAAARRFGERIAFVHVRDVKGGKEDFTELFHDEGSVDQFRLMRTYRSIGLDVPFRGDHVPEMEGDRRLCEECVPGYFTLGRLFANGYLKALLKGTERRVRAIVSAGSNLGRREEYLRKAREALAGFPETELVAESPVEETEPEGVPEEYAGMKFLNCVFVLETGLEAEEFSRRMHAAEDALGRVRGVRNGPRTIDLDLVDFGGMVADLPGLKLPHPRARARKFVTGPLSRLGIDW